MILRICVVIPCFNHPRTISSVVKGVVEATPFPVLLLDDGSETPVSQMLYSFEVKQAQEQGRVRVVRFDQNRGKGAALRFAIEDLVAKGFTHMITLDGDGRHLPGEIIKLVDEAKQHPWDLILGNRGIKEDEGNWLKRASRKLLSYAVRFETGSAIQDTRSGFRCYPLFALQTMRFRTTRYDFEIEVLIRLIWKGFDVREIPIEIAPFDPEEHQTHFQTFTDSLRLSFLNVVLICLSLLKTHNAPAELALAIGLGIFVGCTPAFGFHTLMVIALAIVMRLNFVALWLGTHVSTPVLFPLVFMAEVWIGQHWLHIPAGEGMMGHIYQWTAGSLVLGVLLGVPGAALAYVMAKSMQRKSSQLEDSGPSLRYRLLAFVTHRFGLRAAYVWLRLSSWLRYFNRFNARRGLSEFYSILYPREGFWVRQKRIVSHFRKIGQINADTLARGNAAPSSTDVATANDSHVAASKETYLLSAHLGRRGPEEALDQPWLYPVEILPFLGSLGVFSTRGIAAAAREGKAVELRVNLKTQNGYGDQIFLIPAPASSAARDIYACLSAVVRHIEALVRESPEQWLNAYPFFSTRPKKLEAERAVLFEDLPQA